MKPGPIRATPVRRPSGQRVIEDFWTGTILVTILAMLFGTDRRGGHSR